jgi:hypothetical protein
LVQIEQSEPRKVAEKQKNYNANLPLVGREFFQGGGKCGFQPRLFVPCVFK